MSASAARRRYVVVARERGRTTRWRFVATREMAERLLAVWVGRDPLERAAIIEDEERMIEEAIEYEEAERRWLEEQRYEELYRRGDW